MKRLASIVAIFTCLAVISLDAQVPHFKHIIIVVQENRSTDNFFYGLCQPPYSRSCSTNPSPGQYNIQTSNWRDNTNSRGVTQPGPVALTAPYDLDHTHTSFQRMCDNILGQRVPCRMDGAAAIPCNGTCPSRPQFRYVDNSTGDLNPDFDIATQYGFANYMFQTNQGPSFPAHLFLFGGTSAPSADDDAAGIFAVGNSIPTIKPTGCIAEQTTIVKLIYPPGEVKKEVYPCFDHQTMGDFQQMFSWKYYTPSAGSVWTAPTVIQHICQSSGYAGQCLGADYINNVDQQASHILTDISACTLRDVSWVVPSGQNSDHPGIGSSGGPSWVASIVNSVGTSNQCDNGAGYWKDTAIFITWDDWGGWYDHEPPTILDQPQGDYQYGFRVPLLVVSAYTPAGYTDNGRYDFGSILRFIEQNFGLAEGALNFADARSKTDLTTFFHPGAPRTFKTIPSPLDANFFINDTTPALDPDDQ